MRRYATAGILGEDIERFLSGEAIEAKRDSGWYVLSKQIRRYRGPVLVVCTFVFVAAVALAVSIRSEIKRSEAEAARTVAEYKGNKAEAQNLLLSTPSLTDALANYREADPDVQKLSQTFCRELLASPESLSRIQGVRLAPWLALDEFWTSADGGLLWDHGEWLELSRAAEDRAAENNANEILQQLGVAGKATDGTDREKYIAFCLIGQLASLGSELSSLCTQAVRSETDPGVVMAARWAARRLGRSGDLVSNASRDVRVDKTSGLEFVRIPKAKDFRPGSPSTEDRRLSDENRPKSGEDIPPLWVSATEVTLGTIAKAVSPEPNDKVGQSIKTSLDVQNASLIQQLGEARVGGLMP